MIVANAPDKKNVKNIRTSTTIMKVRYKIMMTIKEAYQWIKENTNLMQDTTMLDFECLAYCVKHGILKEVDKGHFAVA